MVDAKRLKLIEHPTTTFLRVSQDCNGVPNSILEFFEVGERIQRLEIEDYTFYNVNILRREFDAVDMFVHYEMDYVTKDFGKLIKMDDSIESTDEFLKWLKT